eukprot:4350650-Prymnesium_polylepis.2
MVTLNQAESRHALARIADRDATTLSASRSTLGRTKCTHLATAQNPVRRLSLATRVDTRGRTSKAVRGRESGEALLSPRRGVSRVVSLAALTAYGLRASGVIAFGANCLPTTHVTSRSASGRASARPRRPRPRSAHVPPAVDDPRRPETPRCALVEVVCGGRNTIATAQSNARFWLYEARASSGKCGRTSSGFVLQKRLTERTCSGPPDGGVADRSPLIS